MRRCWPGGATNIRSQLLRLLHNEIPGGEILNDLDVDETFI
jgi:hypothetical protein